MTYSLDPSFHDPAKMTEVVIESNQKGNGQKVDIDFEPKFNKAIYFKFTLLDNDL